MSAPGPATTRPALFRRRLWVVMMLTISGLTGAGLLMAQRQMASSVQRELEEQFRAELARLKTAESMRQVVLLERCRTLVRRARIHAALEDDAFDLLYPSAQDELRDLLRPAEEETARPGMEAGLRGEFYRFLERSGAVISPPPGMPVGGLTAEEERRLALPKVPALQQLGFLRRGSAEGAVTVQSIITMPIISSESEEPVSALVVGFGPAATLPGEHGTPSAQKAVWMEKALGPLALSTEAREALEEALRREEPAEVNAQGVTLRLDGEDFRVFRSALNPGSLYPLAEEVVLFPLATAQARERAVQWRILLAGVALLAVGLATTRLLARRLSQPVEALEDESQQAQRQRHEAESALERRSQELDRVARFSADASHQLKTPLTVMRAGLEEVLAKDGCSPAAREELSALVHQTYRLAHIVEDLLLLSRMDAGQLRLAREAVDLSLLIEAGVDDLEAAPDGLELEIETDVPAGLCISGERRYTSMIVQNLLENARKYNRAGGRIEVKAHAEEGEVFLSVSNSGAGISASAREHIFERFHRGAVGENVPGYGLGLNLARQLARLHGGDLWLSQSEADWTQFCVRFPLARP